MSSEFCKTIIEATVEIRRLKMHTIGDVCSTATSELCSREIMYWRTVISMTRDAKNACACFERSTSRSASPQIWLEANDSTRRPGTATRTGPCVPLSLQTLNASLASTWVRGSVVYTSSSEVQIPPATFFLSGRLWVRSAGPISILHPLVLN